MEKKRELIVSVTAKDCKFDYIRGSGKGGQKKNKTVRCTHLASGASGFCEEHREQHRNKQLAFEKWQRRKFLKHGFILNIAGELEYWIISKKSRKGNA